MTFQVLRKLDAFKASGLKDPSPLKAKKYASISRLRVIIEHVFSYITYAFKHPTNLFQKDKKLTKSQLDQGLESLQKNAPHFAFNTDLVTRMNSQKIDNTAEIITNIQATFSESTIQYMSIPVLINGNDHIVQIFIDKVNNHIEYYDLRLSDPDHKTIHGTNMTVRELMNTLNANLFTAEKPATILVNKNKLQNDFHNCGIHIFDVIIKRLDGLTFNHFQHMANIGEIEKIREKLEPYFKNIVD